MSTLIALVICSAMVTSAQAQEEANVEASTEVSTAEASTDEATRMRARELGAAAIDAFERGEYQLALERFTEAYEIVPIVELRFNIAMTYERLGRFRDAVDEYDAVLGTPGLSENASASAREGRQRVSERLSALRFTGRDGVIAVVDSVQRCALPCELAVDPGTRVVVFEGGDGPHTRQVSARPGATIEVHFEPRMAPDPAPSTPAEPTSRFPSWLTWIGAPVAAVGIVGITYFGIQTVISWNDFADNPSNALADDGEQTRLLTNLSIGVAALGAALVLLDLVLDAAD